ncbi:ATP-binding protein [Desulfonatronum sp. SC1]|uniref:ATP-binding protein n=1 Tax=Desulfonatronum sp. SC1 TaxID=2109626 RepID=UPI00130493EB|nr:ATP-binding protein [Desulfonatronum sp. SC1]
MEQKQEKLQVQLLQAQKMEAVGVLTSGVAHNFNNILQTMVGTIELMRRSVPHEHPNADRLRTLANSVDRGAHLVRQLLQFSRKAETHKEWTNMNREIAHVVALLEHVIPRMISVELRLAEEIWTVNADRIQVEQVLLNLANNAVDAMPDGGRLIFTTQNVVVDDPHALGLAGVNLGPHVLLTVTDTGCGMDEETLRHLFDPFFTTKGNDKGTGLGLATAYGIITDHGGDVACFSEPGLVTTFQIHWPAVLDRGETRDVQEQVAPDYPHGDETILVVDDEPGIREVTGEALESLGYTVIAVKNGEEALIDYEKKKEAIRLVILDLGMPGMGGRPCLLELRRIDPEVKVLVSSGYHGAGLVDDILKNGAAGFIHKPYQLRDLAVRIRDVLDHGRQENGEVKQRILRLGS